MTSAVAAGKSTREGDEAYAKTVLEISDRWRIVACRDGIQWIVQKRVSAKGATREQWRGVKYHRSREGLIEALVRLEIRLTALQRATLLALPLMAGPS